MYFSQQLFVAEGKVLVNEISSELDGSDVANLKHALPATSPKYFTN